MTAQYISLQGTSGAGKGTRTLQLIKYLQDGCGFTPIPAKLNLHGNLVNLGIYFKEVDTLFIGKIAKSRNADPLKKLYSWSSGDPFTANNVKVFSLTDKLGVYGSSLLTYLIGKLDCTVVCEGYPGTTPDPNNVGEIIGYNNILCIFYKYPDVDKIKVVQERCFTRTGKYPKAVSSSSSEGKCRSIVNNLKNLPEATVIEVSFDVDISHFGVNYFEFILRPKEVPEFLKWSECNSFIRHINKTDINQYNPRLEYLHKITNDQNDSEYLLLNNILNSNNMVKSVRLTNLDEPKSIIEISPEEFESYLR